MMNDGQAVDWSEVDVVGAVGRWSPTVLDSYISVMLTIQCSTLIDSSNISFTT